MRFFRLNCEGPDQDKVRALLAEEGFVCRNLSGNDHVMAAVNEPCPLGNSLAHYFGYIYIQDISSILPVMLLNPGQNSVVLDMCASPGSKTGQLARAVGPGGMVAANEPNPSRLATLRANLKRMNLTNVITSGYCGQDLAMDGMTFDYILLDVPCSGWGVQNKNPAGVRIWTEDRLSSLKVLQRTLLETAAKLLNPGGKLVYSTCTTNIEENEDQIHLALKTLPLKSLEPGLSLPSSFDYPDIEITNPGMMRVKGSHAGGQDFFMAVLTTTPGAGHVKISRKQNLRIQHGEPVEAGEDIRRPEYGNLWNYSGNVFFVPDKAWHLLNMGLAAQGIHVGKKRGKKFILSPRMRVFLPDNGQETGFNARDTDQVNRLVSGQSLFFPTSKDLAGFYWNGLGLGWLKVKNNRLLWSDR